MLAPLLVLMLAIPIIVIVCVLVVAVLMAPSIVSLVRSGASEQLERKRGGTFVHQRAVVAWLHPGGDPGLGAFHAAVVGSALVLVLPPLIWGWLTYRVMAFDALAEHASKPERGGDLQAPPPQPAGHRHSDRAVGRRARHRLGLGGGVRGGFFVLVPVAIWIYTLVFAFSSLWFTHYCLAALQRLREQGGDAGARLCQPPVIATSAPPALARSPSSDPQPHDSHLRPHHRRRRDPPASAWTSICQGHRTAGRARLALAGPTMWATTAAHHRDAATGVCRARYGLQLRRHWRHARRPRASARRWRSTSPWNCTPRQRR